MTSWYDGDRPAKLGQILWCQARSYYPSRVSLATPGDSYLEKTTAIRQRHVEGGSIIDAQPVVDGLTVDVAAAEVLLVVMLDRDEVR